MQLLDFVSLARQVFFVLLEFFYRFWKNGQGCVVCGCFFVTVPAMLFLVLQSFIVAAIGVCNVTDNYGLGLL